MPTIQITFPWGRYCAHPWGLNPTRLREAEWPPSPWRLLRTLAAAWYRAHPGQAPSDEAIALIEGLGRELPDIGVGPVSFSQTVHWQPNYGTASAEEKREASYKKARHENHFVAVSCPVLFRWSEVALSTALRDLLTSLLAEVSYFGRAESLCHAALLSGDPSERSEIGWCPPCFDSENRQPARRISADCRDVFCPNPCDFQLTDLWARRATRLKPDSPEAPPHLVDQLLSSDMKADGALWVSYQMPVGWPEKWVVRTPRSQRPIRPPAWKGPRIAHYLRFSLQCRVPLLAKFAVPLAEQFRSAANHHFCRVHGPGESSFALFGHSGDRPCDAVGDHQHAFYLPMGHDESQPGTLTDLHIWCPYGLSQAETEILLRVHRLVWGNGRFPVRPVLVAMSKDPPAGAPIATGRTRSLVWQSASPFVPPRHFYRGDRVKAKLKVKDSPERQLIGCLRQAGVVAAVTVFRLTRPGQQDVRLESLPPRPAWEIVRAPEGDELAVEDTEAVSVHQNGSDGVKRHHRRIGFSLRLEFSEAVALPMPSFGHSSHFGLGLFVPVAGVGEAGGRRSEV